MGTIFHDIKHLKDGYSTHSDLTRVTRSDIDHFIPKTDSDFAGDFDYLLRSGSFNKFIKFKDLRNEKHNSYLSEQTTCSICLEDYNTSSELIVLPCLHYYHFECFLELGTHSASYGNDIQGTQHVKNQRYGANIKCPQCQLNLLRHYLFYKENGLNPEIVDYFNNE